MAGMKPAILLALATVLTFEPVLSARRVDHSGRGGESGDLGGAAGGAGSMFDGVWRQGDAFVTVQDNQFIGADGSRLEAGIHQGTITITYGSGDVYTGELTTDGELLIWSDGDVWERYKAGDGRPNAHDPTMGGGDPYFQGAHKPGGPGGAYIPGAQKPGHHGGSGPFGGAGAGLHGLAGHGDPYIPGAHKPDHHGGDGPYGGAGGDQGDDPAARFRPINPRMKRGKRGQPLIPELVPPPGYIYEFLNKEKPHVAQFFAEGIDTNAYKWEFNEIKRISDGREFKVDQRFAKLKGKWQSNSFGHKSVHIYNKQGDELCKIRMNKHSLNPFRLRWSFRVLPPGSKDNDDALFTINKDWFGKGFLWMKEEWRVYRGRERDDDMIYYGVGSYIGWDFKFYRSKRDYKRGKEVLAKIEQKVNVGAFVNHGFLPDKFKLKVYPGEDSAILLVVSTIIDMVHDSEGSQGFVDFDF